MVDRGHFLRRALGFLPPNFVSVDQAALDSPPRFRSTDHLSTEAVAAYADGELLMKAHLRAASHLSQCPQCAAEVDAQMQARAALRDSHPVTMPSTLMGLLSQIPQTTPEEPESPEGDGSGGGNGAGEPRGRRKRR